MHTTPIPFAAVRDWLFDAALPLWADAGVDRAYGGFFEELSADGAATDRPTKRVRTMARQTYAYAHAAQAGWPAGKELADMGIEYLVRRAWLGPDNGWAKLLSRSGEAIDTRPDLYDMACVLLALAWQARIAGNAEAQKLAHQTLDFMDRRMRTPAAAGFVNILPQEGPRQQNPHMHMLEACLAAYETWKQQRFLDVAREIVALCRQRFFDGFALAEYFDEVWNRMPDDSGSIIEPGHQFEWAWLLSQFQQASGEVIEEIGQFVDGPETYCIDPTSHAVFNSVSRDGSVRDPCSRTWPNTERIKGHLALFEITGRDPHQAVAASTRLLLDRYFNVAPRGLWCDQFDAAGKPMAGPAPASTLYHATAAILDLLRLEPRLR